jgi:hypothetical protein
MMELRKCVVSPSRPDDWCAASLKRSDVSREKNYSVHVILLACDVTRDGTTPFEYRFIAWERSSPVHFCVAPKVEVSDLRTLFVVLPVLKGAINRRHLRALHRGESSKLHRNLGDNADLKTMIITHC